MADPPKPELKRFEFAETAMGTQFRLVLYVADRDEAVAAVTAVFRRVRELENVLSDYKSTSEVMRLCRANDTEPGIPRPISDDLLRVVQHAMEASKLSDGAFDVTIGPLSQLWRETRKSQQLPAPEVLAAAQDRVGWQYLKLDPLNKTLTLHKPGMRLDFGGIGKGFAADEAMRLLKHRGIRRALVAAAGDITVSDPPPGREAWNVDIAGIGRGRPARTVRLVNASVSTSGDLFQSVEIAGVRYSHVLNPRTGLGLTGRRSVTVIAPTGWQADSYTKLASILPPLEALKRLATVPGTAVFMVTQESDDAAEVVQQSANFPEYLVK